MVGSWRGISEEYMAKHLVGVLIEVNSSKTPKRAILLFSLPGKYPILDNSSTAKLKRLGSFRQSPRRTLQTKAEWAAMKPEAHIESRETIFLTELSPDIICSIFCSSPPKCNTSNAVFLLMLSSSFFIQLWYYKIRI